MAKTTTTKKTTVKAVKTEKTVKVKLHTGEIHECLETEYLTAKKLLGDNYPGELITE